jgi:hypothetical protein
MLETILKESLYPYLKQTKNFMKKTGRKRLIFDLRFLLKK